MIRVYDSAGNVIETHHVTLPLKEFFMDISLKTLEEALAVRRQIDSLQKRLSAILEGSAPLPTGPIQGGRYFSPRN
jgi:hypothetical protein